MTENYLFDRAASRLAKRPVKAFIRDPIVQDSKGCAYVDHHGNLTIEIRPGRSDEGTLETFIHESLHFRFNHVTTPHKREVRPGEIEEKTITGTNHIMSDNELEVWQNLHFWRSVAEKYAHLYNGTWLEKRLKALWLQGSKEPTKPVLSDFDRMIEDMIDQAATKAARAALAKVGL